MDINFLQQFRNFRKIIFGLIITLIILLLLVYAVGYVYLLPLDVLLGDPASIYGYNQFTGLITFIGAIILSAGVGAVILALLMVAPLFKRDGKSGKALIAVSILALISLFLVLDDLFLLHERVFTGLLHVGERRIFLIYVVLFTAVMYTFRKELLSGPIILFVLAGLLFAGSLGVDFLSDKLPMSDTLADFVMLLEETCKLGGYLFWTAFIFWRSKVLLETGSKG